MKNCMTKSIIIIGGAGTSINIIEHIADAIMRYSMPVSIGGIIIDSFDKGYKISGFPVIGNKSVIPELLKDDCNYFIFAMYKPEKMRERYQLMESLMIPPGRYTNFIHPLAYVAESVSLGYGNVILSNSTINSKTKLGNMNIINSNVTIEHEASIGDGNFVAAGSVVGARARIVNHCFLGLNSSVREDVVLDEVFVGMHSLVLKNFGRCTVLGVPAKKYERESKKKV